MKPEPNTLVEESHHWVARGSKPECVFVLHAPQDMPLFADHFEGSPLLPAFSQMGELVTRAHRVWPDLGPWEGASNIKFKAPIRPGSQVHMRLTRLRSDTVKFSMLVQDTVCATGSLAFGCDDAKGLPE